MRYISKYDNYQKIMENVALAKAILRRLDIPVENEKFQKIINTTNRDGYTGLLTKLVFNFNIDIDEVLDLYKDMKENQVNAGELMNKSYDEILDIVYPKDEEGITRIFNYDNYVIFYVKDYESGLDICSPAWCLKTKSMWDSYMIKRKGQQFVMIDESYIKNGKILLSVPNNFHGDTYTNTRKPEIRYGITVYPKGDFNFFNDNNKTSYSNNKETKLLSDVVNNILDWMKNNGLLNTVNYNVKDYNVYKNIILQIIEDDFSGSFDNSTYTEGKNYINVILKDINEKGNITEDEIKRFFEQYKDIILSDEDFTMKNGTMDILLYHFYGKSNFELSGILLGERDFNDYTYKYYYGFHKYYWGRKCIEQSFENIINWYQTIGENFYQLLIDDETMYGSEYFDMFKLSSFDNTLYDTLTYEKTDNGCKVIFKIKEFSDKYIIEDKKLEYITTVLALFNKETVKFDREKGILYLELSDEKLGIQVQ